MMNSKTIGLLGAATLLILVGALAINMHQSKTVSDTVLGEAFFPTLSQQANDISTVEIIKGSTKITLLRQGEQWVIAERANFPANVDAIRNLVFALVELKAVESKTSRQDQYEKIGVEDPAGPEATGVGVTLKGPDGAVRASLVVGNTYEGADATKPMLYVRRLNEQQSWLVQGTLTVPTETSAFIDKARVVDIFRSRVKSMKFVLASGEQYLIFRDKPDDKGFQYRPLPAGFTIRSQARLDDMASALEHVVPDDVLANAPSLFEEKGTSFGEYQTFDGVTVKSKLSQHEDKWIVSYSASIAENPGSAEDAKKTVEGVNKLAAWAFVVPEAKALLMQKPNADVLVKAGK